MKQRLLSLFAMLSLIVSGAMAQSLTVADITTEAGQKATITVAIEGVAEMTALQFNLSLPEGFELDGDIILRDGAINHTLYSSTLASGDLFVVLYSLDQNTFSNGYIVNIPVAVAENAVSSEAHIYNIRTATVKAVSHTLSDVAFALNVANDDNSITPLNSQSSTEVYDLMGRRVEKMEKGIYIVNGKKVIK